MPLDRRYWDSDAFLGHLQGDPDKASACAGVLEAAESGRIMIVTSALTIAEVLYIRGKSKIEKHGRDKIAAFFKQPFISVVNVTRDISEMAQDIYWDSGIMPKDAIHVATAITYKVPVLNTFDGDLLNKNRALGTPPLRIERPYEPGQTNLKLS